MGSWWKPTAAGRGGGGRGGAGRLLAGELGGNGEEDLSKIPS